MISNTTTIDNLHTRQKKMQENYYSGSIHDHSKRKRLRYAIKKNNPNSRSLCITL